MKALIIENEIHLDISIQAFLNDNPKLFTEIDEQLYCLNRSMKSLLPHVMDADAIVVASTWMYKDQLLEYLEAFTNKFFTKKLSFYVYSFIRTLNEWGNSEERWQREDTLFTLVKTLIDNGHKLYDYFYDDENGEKVTDKLDLLSTYDDKERERYTVIPHELFFDKKSNLFFNKTYKYHSLDNLKLKF